MPSSYTIGKHFEEFIRSQIKTGRYTSASEVVRDGLRLLEESETRREAALYALRKEVDKGRKGNLQPAQPVFTRLTKKYSRSAKSRA